MHNPSAFASLWLWEGTSIGLVAFLAAVYLAVFLFAFYALRKLHATQQQHLQTPVTRRRRRRRQGQGNSTARRKRWSRYRQNMWNTFDIAYSGDDDHPADYGSSGEEYRQYNEWVKDTIHSRPRTRSVTEALAQAGHAVPFGVLSPAAVLRPRLACPFRPKTLTRSLTTPVIVQTTTCITWAPSLLRKRTFLNPPPPLLVLTSTSRRSLPC